MALRESWRLGSSSRREKRRRREGEGETEREGREKREGEDVLRQYLRRQASVGSNSKLFIFDVDRVSHGYNQQSISVQCCCSPRTVSIRCWNGAAPGTQTSSLYLLRLKKPLGLGLSNAKKASISNILCMTVTYTLFQLLSPTLLGKDTLFKLLSSALLRKEMLLQLLSSILLSSE